MSTQEIKDPTTLLLMEHDAGFFEIQSCRINKAVPDGDYVCFLYKKDRKTVCKIILNHIKIHLMFQKGLQCNTYHSFRFDSH